MKDRVILHCDMNSFFCSVELLEHPELKDKPVAVSGSADQRHGIILAKNELAKKAGVVTAETIWQAKKKCPDLVFLPPHHEKYKDYFKKINDIYQRYTDMVEPFSIDESWLDVTASQSLFGDGKTIADSIRETVKKELGLTLSAGVSYNKIFAKMGSDYKKPDATTVITRENYKELLWPLPTKDMFFCGRASQAKLAELGIKTIGDIATADPKMLDSYLGKMGYLLWEYTNGLDESPVAHFGEVERAKSLGHGITFPRDLTSQEDVETASEFISDSVAFGLRKQQLKATGVKVDIKDPLFKTISRQKKLDAPTNIASEICKAALEIVADNWNINKQPIRLLTITAINLIDENEATQLSLFQTEETSRAKTEQVERTMDEIRARFGADSMKRASLLNNKLIK